MAALQTTPVRKEITELASALARSKHYKTTVAISLPNSAQWVSIRLIYAPESIMKTRTKKNKDRIAERDEIRLLIDASGVPTSPQFHSCYLSDKHIHWDVEFGSSEKQDIEVDLLKSEIEKQFRAIKKRLGVFTANR